MGKLLKHVGPIIKYAGHFPGVRVFIDILPGLKARGFPSAQDVPCGSQDVGSGVPVTVVVGFAATTAPASYS